MTSYKHPDHEDFAGEGVTLKELPPALRPCDRIAGAGGARQLSHVDLISVLLAPGNSLPPARRIVRRYGIAALGGLTYKEWRSNGIGPAAACRLVAALELARRVEKAGERELPRISVPKDVYAHVRELATAKKEHLLALYLDAQNHLLARETISIGSLNTTRTHPREILQPAITHLALGFILVHNHPTGSLVPSSDDVEFTRAIGKAAELMGIPLYDHVIVSREGFVSMKEKGLL